MADWIQSIERQPGGGAPGLSAGVPRLSGAQAPPPRAPLGRPWTGGNLFPVSRPHPLPSVFPKRDLFSPACRPGLRPGNHPLPPGAGGLGDEGGAHPLSGPRGSLSAPHGLLRPLHPPLSPGILRGLLHLPEPGHPVPGFAARLGPGRRLPPGNSAAVLSPGPPHVSPRADRAGPYFLSALRSAGSPSACLTTC